MEKQPEINVESYQKVASLGGWAGAGRTLWAISTVATVAGALIGLVAPFVPAILGLSSAAAAWAALPISLAIFAGTGLAAGFAGGAMLGRISGSVASVAEEGERRSKEWTIRQMKALNPDTPIIADAPKENPPEKPFEQRVSDAYHTYINPKVGLAFTLIGIVGGLIMGAAFIASNGAAGVLMGGVPVIAKLTGLAATAVTPQVIMAYSAGVCGAFGALWNFNFPKITSETTQFFGSLISGKMFGREWGPAPAQAPQQPAPAAECTHCDAAEKEAPQTTRIISFRALVQQQPAEDGLTLAKR